MKPSLVLEASPWEIADEKTGEVRRGVSLFYVDLESPLVGRKQGFETLRISGSDHVVKDQLRAIPGWYRFGYRQRAGKTGRVELTLSAVEYVGPLDAPPDA